MVFWGFEVWGCFCIFALAFIGKRREEKNGGGGEHNT